MSDNKIFYTTQRVKGGWIYSYFNKQKNKTITNYVPYYLIKGVTND